MFVSNYWSGTNTIEWSTDITVVLDQITEKNFQNPNQLVSVALWNGNCENTIQTLWQK